MVGFEKGLSLKNVTYNYSEFGYERKRAEDSDVERQRANGRDSRTAEESQRKKDVDHLAVALGRFWRQD